MFDSQCRRISVAILLALLAVPTVHAQIGDPIRLGDTCSYFGEQLPKQVATFSSDAEAEQVIQRIVDASGLAKNFNVQAAGVPNAAAVIQGTTRFILYSQYFMQQVRQATGSSWAPVSIMAHEIGHHLNGHTFLPGGSRPKIELEADYFSGFVLQRLGASLDDARTAMEKIGSPTGSSTHPPKYDRLAAITSGWKKSCDADPRCASPPPPSTAGQKPQKEPQQPQQKPEPQTPSQRPTAAVL
jgi:hypothetical protein